MKKIKLENDSFELNGKRWYIADDVTIGRLSELEKVIHHFVNGVDVSQQQVILKEIYDDMNSMKFAEAGRKVYNLYNATVVYKAGMPHPKLLIATMFINHKDEDLSVWNMELATEKIRAWEGAESSFFLSLAEKFLTDMLTRIFGISENFSKAMISVGEARTKDTAVTDRILSNISKSKTK